MAKSKETVEGQQAETQVEGQDTGTQSEGHDTVTTASDITFNVGDFTLSVPVPFNEGHVLTANQSKVLSAAYVRQFRNNQEAALKAESKKREKGETIDKPITVEGLQALFTTYEPQVGGVGIDLDALRQDAALEVLKDIAKDQKMALPKVADRPAYIEKILSSPKYAEALQIKIDAIEAKRKAEKPIAAAKMSLDAL